MRWLLVTFIVAHALIHLLGATKGFGLAELPQLTQPVSRAAGVLWLIAALALLITAAMFAANARQWWLAGAVAMVLSQIAIATSWSDAKFGTVANVVLLAAVVYGFASSGPFSFRAQYERAAARRSGRMAATRNITDDDIAHLPAPVQRYLRVSGAAGAPRVERMRATWRGRIRGSATDPWMEFTAEQTNTIAEPTRLFLMNATRGGLPVDVLHIFDRDGASMRVRLLSLVPMVSESGPALTKAETVTLFNDWCVLAPGALIDRAIEWERVDDRTARARFTLGANTIGAELRFNEAGDLVDFVSDDRLATLPDGRGPVAWRWSTPVSEYRRFGPHRAAGRGSGVWHAPDGAFTYIELELLGLRMNER